MSTHACTRTRASPRPCPLAADHWTQNFVGDLKSMVMVWVPLHSINFRYVPLHLRTPFMSAMGLIWVFVLSATRGSEKEPQGDQDGTALGLEPTANEDASVVRAAALVAAAPVDRP